MERRHLYFLEKSRNRCAERVVRGLWFYRHPDTDCGKCQHSSPHFPWEGPSIQMIPCACGSDVTAFSHLILFLEGRRGPKLGIGYQCSESEKGIWGRLKVKTKDLSFAIQINPWPDQI